MENQEFISHYGIKHFQVPIPAHKAPIDCIPLSSMMRALQILRDQENYPILVHCNKGKVSRYSSTLTIRVLI